MNYAIKPFFEMLLYAVAQSIIIIIIIIRYLVFIPLMNHTIVLD